MKFDPTDDLSNPTALKIIKEILDAGAVFYSNHAKKRMRERGYDNHDVIFVLSNGSIIEKKFDARNSNWIYKIEGYDVDGDAGVVLTAIIGKWEIEIITVLS